MFTPRSLARWAAAAAAAAGLGGVASAHAGGRPYDIGAFGRGGAPDRGLVGGFAPGYGGYGAGYAGYMRGVAYPGYYGPQFYPGFGYGYPFFPYYPGAYQNSWSNGFALAGPPIRTDAPIPGRFGGSDQKGYGLTPDPVYGFGPNFGTNPATRPRGNYPGGPAADIPFYRIVTAPPGTPAAPPAADPDADGVPLPQPRKADQARAGLASAQRVGGGEALVPVGVLIDVTLADPAAELLIDGRPTKMTGPRRQFKSPPLEPGRVFSYEVTARWTAGGVPVAATRTVEVTGGEYKAVDLTRPDATP